MTDPSLEPFHSWHLITALFFVFLNGFFVAAEFAMVKVRTTRLETLQEKGGIFARWALAIVHQLNDYLSATQLGITLSSLGLGWLGEPAFAKILTPLFGLFSLKPQTVHAISFTLAFALITMLHLVLGELVPKQIAIQTAEKVLLALAIPMRIFYVIFSPFLCLLNKITRFVLKLMGVRESSEHEVHSEEELRLIVENSYEEGSISPRKASLLENVFEFSQRVARDIMIPRRDIISLEISKSAEENLAIARESGHTRFPLCDGGLDHILGIIIIKDVIWKLEDPDNLINLYDLKRPILFIPEGKPVDQILREFQSNKNHMAIVVDEYGGTSGLITMEDIIEEIVGEIQDEYDKEQPRIFRQSDDQFVVEGIATIREVEQALDVALHEETQVSIGGYFTNRLSRMPKEGDEILITPYRVVALEVKSRRVLKLLFEKMKEIEESPSAESEL